jgi:hypothetical protein
MKLEQFERSELWQEDEEEGHEEEEEKKKKRIRGRR